MGGEDSTATRMWIASVRENRSNRGRRTSPCPSDPINVVITYPIKAHGNSREGNMRG